jgi:ketosteroid isomerase-like protein
MEDGMTRRVSRALAAGVGIAIGLAASARAAESWESEIRAAEEKHVRAFLEEDAAAIDAMLSNDFVVNSPLNSVVEKKPLLGMVRSGALTISEFAQDIETMRRFGDVVFVMGADRVVWVAPSPNAGKTHRRRFTDVWRLEGGRWVFIARQATLLCP